MSRCSALPELDRPAGDDVHVWVATLDTSDDALRLRAGTLSSDEQRRCEAFKFERHRRLFVARRTWLRTLIGRYLDVAPDRLRFVYGPNGKPELSPDCASGDLRFNLTHSGGLALLAATEGRPLGVDLEALRSLSGAEEIAERFFSPNETRKLRSLAAPLRTEAFYKCWTRKEAYIKALGQGLACSLDSFEVTFLPGEPAQLEGVPEAPAAGERWHLRDLAPAPGYVGALAVLGREALVVARNWTDAV